MNKKLTTPQRRLLAQAYVAKLMRDPNSQWITKGCAGVLGPGESRTARFLHRTGLADAWSRDPWEYHSRDDEIFSIRAVHITKAGEDKIEQDRVAINWALRYYRYRVS